MIIKRSQTIENAHELVENAHEKVENYRGTLTSNNGTFMNGQKRIGTFEPGTNSGKHSQYGHYHASITKETL